MKYKLFDDYITLQALFKELGLIPSGGAIKNFLSTNTVLFNGEDEKRRGKKIRIGDKIQLPDQDITIMIISPNEDEIAEHQKMLSEKARVATIVKEMNKTNKKKVKNPKSNKKKVAIRFPGT